MATYLPKRRGDILRNALRKIEQDTGVNTTTVGSVARSFTEAITTEIADLYDLLDYNITQTNLSTASGRHLDAIGATYNLPRGTISHAVDVARTSGSFYFYVDEPAITPIVIPRGTRVYTSGSNFVGRQLAYSTTEDVTIATGESKVFAGLTYEFASNEVTAGRNTLTVNDAVSTIPGVVIHSTNPKPIYAQRGYESDTNYRARIIKRLAVQATGSLDSIRYALLGRPNIRDVQLYSTRLGLGVVEVVIVPDELEFSRDQIAEIKEIVDSARPSGVRVMIRTPERLTAEINGMIFLRQSRLEVGDEGVIVARCLAALRNHINSLLPGDPLMYNRLIDIILSVSDKIVDVSITNFRVGGSSSIRTNYTPKPEQIIVPGRIDLVSSIFT